MVRVKAGGTHTGGQCEPKCTGNSSVMPTVVEKERKRSAFIVRFWPKLCTQVCTAHNATIGILMPVISGHLHHRRHLSTMLKLRTRQR